MLIVKQDEDRVKFSVYYKGDGTFSKITVLKTPELLKLEPIAAEIKERKVVVKKKGN